MPLLQPVKPSHVLFGTMETTGLTLHCFITALPNFMRIAYEHDFELMVLQKSTTENNPIAVKQE